MPALQRRVSKASTSTHSALVQSVLVTQGSPMAPELQVPLEPAFFMTQLRPSHWSSAAHGLFAPPFVHVPWLVALVLLLPQKPD